MRKLTQLLLALWLVSMGCVLHAGSRALVSVPVADLRSEPSVVTPGVSDEKQQTQLLFGESVNVYESSGIWIRVEAIEQPSYKYHHKWQGYPGWVLANELTAATTRPMHLEMVQNRWLTVNTSSNTSIRIPLGSKFEKSSALASDNIKEETGQSLRARILNVAELFIGDPYVWGGLSPFDESRQIPLTGVDCSALVHLAYRANHITVPRDSIDQYRKAKKIRRRELRPADLIFSANLDKPDKIVHVMIYAGGDDVIEAPRTGETVHRTTFTKKTGVPLTSVESGQKLKDRVVYFGRLLND